MELAKVKVPYPLPPAINEEARERHMKWSSGQGYPRVKFRPMTNEIMQIIAYGPSLEDTWKEIDSDQPLLTMSGSLKFLLEKGLKPKWGRWFHTDVDPRAHKGKAIVPHKEVIYFLGSVSHPETFKMLDGYPVVLWHAVSGPHTSTWVAENDPGQVLVAGGSTIGLSSIHLAGVFGYCHFRIHGMDGSFRGENRHAGFHGGMKQGQRPSLLNEAYQTSRLMDNANFETIAMLQNFPVFCVFYGDGVIQDWVGKAQLINAARAWTPEAEKVLESEYVPLTPEEAELMAA